MNTPKETVILQRMTRCAMLVGMAQFNQDDSGYYQSEIFASAFRIHQYRFPTWKLTAEVYTHTAAH